MLKIIMDKTQGKKYIESVKKAFDIYKLSEKMKVPENCSSKRIMDVLNCINESKESYTDDLKRIIVKEHLLGDKSVEEIACDMGYSTTYIYNIRTGVLKDFATLLYEVIVL